MAISLPILLIFITLAAVALAGIYTARTIYLRMRRRLELADATHAEALKSMELDHDERLARLQRDADQARQYAHHKLALEVLPVIDALDEASKFTTSPENTPQPAIQHGVQLAKKQLLQALERHGIEYITPAPGDTFEPVCHEAVHLVDDDKLEAGQVARCLRAGFRQDDRVLRSAMVEVVSRPPTLLTQSPASPPEPEDDTPETPSTPTPRNVDVDTDDGADSNTDADTDNSGS